MTLRSSLSPAVRLPELQDRFAVEQSVNAADPDQQPAMTVTVQVTLPRPGTDGASAGRSEFSGGASLDIASELAERLHAMASTRAGELVPDAHVSTSVSMVTQSMVTQSPVMPVSAPEAGASAPATPAGQAPVAERTLARPAGLPPAQRTRNLPRLVGSAFRADSLHAASGAIGSDGAWAVDAAADEVAAEAMPLHIFASRREALLDGDLMVLTRREYELLVFLVERPGRVFTRRQLLNWVWGEDVVSGERTVDVHVRRLRAKLRRRGPVITTIRGVGYRLDRVERVTVS